MKKLRNKVFLVIFLLLTSFTFLVIFTSTTRFYFERKNSITTILTNMSRINVDEKKRNEKPFPEARDDRRIYLDFTIYTVVLDDDGNYKEIINNTNNDYFNEDIIKKEANNIIKNHDKDFYIGNLYTNKYSYTFTNDNTLIMMDNSRLNSMLLKQLINNIIIFIISELFILLFTNIITKWIISPVKKTFERQKTFVADASHELKTPLSVMIASADAYFNDKDEKWVKNMQNESNRMIKLVTELLDLAKTEEEQDIVLEEKDLSNIIESSILTFESLFYEKDIKLKYDIEENIKYKCNENLIIQLVSILIDNAIKHTKKKDNVIVNLYKKNKQIILEVKNKGIPIKKEDEEKIFERFYKVDTSRNRDSNNYGLGLAIAKNITLKHGGEISAHSSNGYTTFKVLFNKK